MRFKSMSPAIITIIAILTAFVLVTYAQTDTQPKANAAGLLSEFNRWRTAIGIRPYQEDVRLSTASQFHSDDQVNRDYFAHIAPSPIECNGTMVTTNWERAACFNTYDRGEGITTGPETADAATRSWLSSYGHCTGVMNPSATHLGGGNNGTMWTFQFNGEKEPDSPVDHESFCQCTSSGDGSEESINACVTSFNDQFNNGQTPPVPPTEPLQLTQVLPDKDGGTYNNGSSGAIGFGRILEGTMTIRIVPVSGNPSGISLELADDDFNKIDGITGIDTITYPVNEAQKFSVWFDSSAIASGETFKVEVYWESSYTSPTSEAVVDEAVTVIEEPIQSSCSANNGEAMTFSVTNNSATPVTLIWIDSNCVEQAYNVIESGQTYEQGTFEGHDWVVRNADNVAIKQYVASISDNNIIIGAPAMSGGDNSASTNECSFPVTTVDDMINAINRANDEVQCPGSDTVFVLNPLSPMAGYNGGDTAFPAITSSITIDGSPQSDDGVIPNITRPADAPQFRFFLVDGTGENTGSLSIQNLILEGGNVLDGGAIFVDARDGGQASLTIDGVTFLRNSAESNGGAVMTLSMNGGQVDTMITNSLFATNTGIYGGAFYNGGFDDGNATAHIIDTQFMNNIGTVEGGAIYNNGLGANGQAIMTLDQGVMFESNSAPNGGAIVSNGRTGGNAQLITLFNLTGLFTNNSADNNGDAILLIGGDGNATFGGADQPIGGSENTCISDDTGNLEFVTCS